MIKKINIFHGIYIPDDKIRVHGIIFSGCEIFTIQGLPHSKMMFALNIKRGKKLLTDAII